MPIPLNRICRIAIAMAVVLATAAPARPGWHGGASLINNGSVDFDVQYQVVATGSGSLVNDDSTLEPFELTAPFEHALLRMGGATPPPANLQTQSEFDLVGSDLKLVGMRNLTLKVLNGSGISSEFEPFGLTADSSHRLFQDLSVYLRGFVTEFKFEQTSSSEVSGTAFAGTFVVPGSFTASNDFDIKFKQDHSSPIIHHEISVPTTLNGSWTSTSLGNGYQWVLLEGSLNLDLPIFPTVAFASSFTDLMHGLSISSTLDFVGSLAMNLSYQSGFLLQIPEPSSIVLLGIGLAAVVGVAVQRRRAYSPPFSK